MSFLDIMVIGMNSTHTGWCPESQFTVKRDLFESMILDQVFDHKEYAPYIEVNFHLNDVFIMQCI